jgi:hypothetical protein
MHAQSDIDRSRANLAVCRVNLQNFGLHDNGCAAAYMAALYVGASAEQAFEAARRHELMTIPAEPYSAQTQRRYQYPNEYDEACQRLASRRAHVLTIANPFADSELVAVAYDRAA